MRLLRRFVTVLGVLLLLLGLGVWGLIRYIAPQEPLDLDAPRVNMEKKVLEMAIELKPELTLTSEEVNSLIKGHLQENPKLENGIELQGADFKLNGNLMSARVNLTYLDLVQIGAAAQYRLVWEKPNLRIIPEQLNARSVTLPSGLLKEIVVPLGSELPSWVGISQVTFEESQVRIRFQAKLPDPGWLIDRLKEIS
ncbi:hypothetical protein ACFOQM_02520 [Paenibacillus sp. GCM10012307]|uniref:DUF2140 family protein n=1 Tax=Paenibacillus roseus TaxID=2798579 RepID=A0A934MJR2_9BACL|nr:hypothetical protein [Paenibacillus roseus]MBJ6360190.1 hypothetical protein [Paenibacillus roseus]